MPEVNNDAAVEYARGYAKLMQRTGQITEDEDLKSFMDTQYDMYLNHGDQGLTDSAIGVAKDRYAEAGDGAFQSDEDKMDFMDTEYFKALDDGLVRRSTPTEVGAPTVGGGVAGDFVAGFAQPEHLETQEIMPTNVPAVAGAGLRGTLDTFAESAGGAVKAGISPFQSLVGNQYEVYDRRATNAKGFVEGLENMSSVLESGKAPSPAMIKAISHLGKTAHFNNTEANTPLSKFVKKHLKENKNYDNLDQAINSYFSSLSPDEVLNTIDDYSELARGYGVTRDKSRKSYEDFEEVKKSPHLTSRSYEPNTGLVGRIGESFIMTAPMMAASAGIGPMATAAYSYGNAYNDMVEGKDLEDTDQAAATALSLFTAAIITPMEQFGVKGITNYTGKAGLKEFLTHAGTAMLTEGGTEAVQTPVEMFMKDAYDTEQAGGTMEDLWELVASRGKEYAGASAEAFASGALMGLAGGGGEYDAVVNKGKQYVQDKDYAESVVPKSVVGETAAVEDQQIAMPKTDTQVQQDAELQEAISGPTETDGQAVGIEQTTEANIPTDNGTIEVDQETTVTPQVETTQETVTEESQEVEAPVVQEEAIPDMADEALMVDETATPEDVTPTPEVEAVAVITTDKEYDQANRREGEALDELVSNETPETINEILNPLSSADNRTQVLSLDEGSGLPLKSSSEYAGKQLDKQGKGYSVVGIDVANMGGNNDFFFGKVTNKDGVKYGEDWAKGKPEFFNRDGSLKSGHEAANVVLKKFWDGFGGEFSQEGEQAYRTGGDEGIAISTVAGQEDASSRMQTVKDNFESLMASYGLDALSHPKLSGLPTGVGVDFGVVQKGEGESFSNLRDQADALAEQNKQGKVSGIVSKNVDSDGKTVYIEDRDADGKQVVYNRRTKENDSIGEVYRKYESGEITLEQFNQEAQDVTRAENTTVEEGGADARHVEGSTTGQTESATREQPSVPETVVKEETDTTDVADAPAETQDKAEAPKAEPVVEKETTQEETPEVAPFEITEQDQQAQTFEEDFAQAEQDSNEIDTIEAINSTLNESYSEKNVSKKKNQRVARHNQERYYDKVAKELSTRQLQSIGLDRGATGAELKTALNKYSVDEAKSIKSNFKELQDAAEMNSKKTDIGEVDFQEEIDGMFSGGAQPTGSAMEWSQGTKDGQTVNGMRDGIKTGEGVNRASGILVTRLAKQMGVTKPVLITSSSNSDVIKNTGYNGALVPVYNKQGKLHGYNVIISDDVMSNKAFAKEVIAHEMGHMAMVESFFSADKNTRDGILLEYNQWRNNNTDETFEYVMETMPPMLAIDAKYRDNLNDSYWKSFEEWFANKIATAEDTKVAGMNSVQKFFYKMFRSLKQLWNGVWEGKGNVTGDTFESFVRDVFGGVKGSKFAPSNFAIAPESDTKSKTYEESNDEIGKHNLKSWLEGSVIVSKDGSPVELHTSADGISTKESEGSSPVFAKAQSPVFIGDTQFGKETVFNSSETTLEDGDALGQYDKLVQAVSDVVGPANSTEAIGALFGDTVTDGTITATQLSANANENNMTVIDTDGNAMSLGEALSKAYDKLGYDSTINGDKVTSLSGFEMANASVTSQPIDLRVDKFFSGYTEDIDSKESQQSIIDKGRDQVQEAKEMLEDKVSEYHIGQMTQILNNINTTIGVLERANAKGNAKEITELKKQRADIVNEYGRQLDAIRIESVRGGEKIGKGKVQEKLEDKKTALTLSKSELNQIIGNAKEILPSQRQELRKWVTSNVKTGTDKEFEKLKDSVERTIATTDAKNQDVSRSKQILNLFIKENFPEGYKASVKRSISNAIKTGSDEEFAAVKEKLDENLATTERKIAKNNLTKAIKKVPKNIMSSVEDQVGIIVDSVIGTGMNAESRQALEELRANMEGDESVIDPNSIDAKIIKDLDRLSKIENVEQMSTQDIQVTADMLSALVEMGIAEKNLLSESRRKYAREITTGAVKEIQDNTKHSLQKTKSAGKTADITSKFTQSVDKGWHKTKGIIMAGEASSDTETLLYDVTGVDGGDLGYGVYGAINQGTQDLISKQIAFADELQEQKKILEDADIPLESITRAVYHLPAGDVYEKGQMKKAGLEHDIELESGETVTLTPANMISVYLLSKNAEQRSALTQDISTDEETESEWGGVVVDIDIDKSTSEFQTQKVVLTETDVDNINSQMESLHDGKVKDFADWIGNKMEDIAGLMNEASIRDRGYKVADILNYFPLIRTDVYKNLYEAGGTPYDSAEMSSDAIFNNPRAVERKPNANATVVITDAVKVLMDTYTFAAEYNTLSDPVRLARQTLERTKNAMKKRGLEDTYAQLQMWLEDISRPATVRSRTDKFDRYLTKTMGNLTVAALQGGAFVQGAQWMSIGTAGRYVDPKISYPELAKVLSVGGAPAAGKSLLNITGEVARGVAGKKLLDKQGWEHNQYVVDAVAEFKEYCPEIYQRIVMGSVPSAIGGLTDKTLLYDYLGTKPHNPVDRTQRFMMSFIQDRDAEVMAALWMSAKKQYGNGKVNDAVIENMNKAVRRTQPTSSLKDRSGLQREAAKKLDKRLMMSFTSVPMKAFNEIKRTKFEYDHSKKTLGDKAKFAGMGAWLLMASQGFYALFNWLRDKLMGRDTSGASLFNKFAMGVGGMNPVFRLFQPVAEGIMEWNLPEDEKKEFSSSDVMNKNLFTSAVKETVLSGKYLQKAISEGDPLAMEGQKGETLLTGAKLLNDAVIKPVFGLNPYRAKRWADLFSKQAGMYQSAKNENANTFEFETEMRAHGVQVNDIIAFDEPFKETEFGTTEKWDGTIKKDLYDRAYANGLSYLNEEFSLEDINEITNEEYGKDYYDLSKRDQKKFIKKLPKTKVDGESMKSIFMEDVEYEGNRTNETYTEVESDN